MPRREFQSFDELIPLVGTEVAVSDWVDITQERVDKFAEPHFSMLWADRIPKVDVRDAEGRVTTVTVVAGTALVIAVPTAGNAEPAGISQ